MFSPKYTLVLSTDNILKLQLEIQTYTHLAIFLFILNGLTSTPKLISSEQVVSVLLRHTPSPQK